MGVIDTTTIRAHAALELGALIDAPATWGVLPEGITVENGMRVRVRLTRSEPCIFLGPPARSRLLLACAILDPSETAEDPIRLYATVNLADLGGLWASGLEDAVSRFPSATVERERAQPIALDAGTLVWVLGDDRATGLSRPLPAFTVGREKVEPLRRAIVLVRGPRKLDPAYVQDAGPSADDGKR